jgi:uncharacterized protein (TIGR02145 family)
MKKIAKKLLIVFLVVISATTQNHAQDIVYSVSGVYNNEKIALDSILVENLTNNTRILFGPLPSRQKYLINLSERLLTSVNGIADEGPVFSVAQNSPGVLKLKYNKNIPISVKIAVYNVNGQSLYSSSGKTVYPGNSVSVKLGASGVYLVKIESPEKIETFKAIGSGNIQEYGVNIEDFGKNSVNILKSTKPPKEFDFNMGDSLRISAYKKDLYAWPEGTRIESSTPIDFQFKQSSVNTTGISDAYVPLNGTITSITGYDPSNGDLEIRITNNTPQLRPGNIITVDLDTMGYLRRIVKIDEIGGIKKITTQPAYLNEVFINKEFKLHTGLINPKIQLKSTGSMNDISEALTDEEGFIHPYKVIYKSSEGILTTKSAFNEKDLNDFRKPLISETIPLEKNFHKDKTTHFYSTNQSKFDLSVNFVGEFKFAEGFDVDQLDVNYKLKKSDLVEYKYYLDGRAELIVKLKLEIEDEMKPIIPKDKKPVELDLGPAFDKFKNVTVHFQIGPVPMWITFNNSILYNYEINANGKLKTEWGFEYVHNLKVGATFDKEASVDDKKFNPFWDKDQDFRFDPLKMKGEVNANAHFEVYPRVEAMVYDFLGPYFEIVPFINGDFHIKGNISTYDFNDLSEQGNFVAWDSKFGIGLDLRMGSKLTFLWGLFDKEWALKEPVHIFNENEDHTKTIFSAPHKLTQLSVLPKNANKNDIIPIKFKVTSFSLFPILNGKPIPFCPIYFESNDDNFRKTIFTDLNGEAIVNWNFDNAGEKRYTAKIYKADASKQEEATVLNAVYGSIYVLPDFSGINGTFKDFRDEAIYDWVKIGNQIWMADNLRHIPKGENFAPPSIPVTNISTIDYSDTYTKPYYYVYGSNGLFQDYVETQATMKAYGVLYNYSAAKCACPEEQGWRLPTDSDWEVLEKYIGEKYGYAKNIDYNYWENVGNRLKSKTWGGDDSFGFNALPAGMRDRENGNFNGLGFATYWWSSTPWLSDCSFERHIFNNHRFYKSHLFNQYGLSVRCIRD